MDHPQSRRLSADDETWQRLLHSGDESLTHDMWVAVIRCVAGRHVPTRDPSKATLGLEDIEYRVESLISRWQHEAQPKEHHLAYIMEDSEFFDDLGVSWEESIQLGGYACGYTLDLVPQLHEYLEFYPDARDAVNDELVESFFSEWRTRFLDRVLREAASLVARSRGTDPEAKDQ